jgi:hypothetical protein
MKVVSKLKIAERRNFVTNGEADCIYSSCIEISRMLSDSQLSTLNSQLSTLSLTAHCPLDSSDSSCK